MTTVTRFTTVPRWRAVALCALTLLAGGAHASDIFISAEFKPSTLNPDKRDFVNTTPWSGVCNSTHLQTCIDNNWWSIDTGIRGTKQAIREDNYGPNGFYVGMPSARTVSVTSDDGQHTFDLRFSIIGTALRLWDQEGDGRTEPASNGSANNCNFGLTNRNANNRSVMRMMLRRDGGEGVVACALHWIDTNNYVMSEFDFTYKLTTPEPLGMPTGIYRGVTTFTVGGTGEGTDFDLGNGVALDDNIVNVHFELDVHHPFELELPPGSDRAVLAPKGGWTQWSDHGIVPKALERELPFTVSSSGQFSVSLQCEYPLPDGRCAIRNMTESADDAPLDIQVSLPGFRVASTGADAVGLPLTTTMAPPIFTTQSLVIRRPSQLYFAVNGEAVRAMLDHPGSHYRGDVTVIFDADP